MRLGFTPGIYSRVRLWTLEEHSSPRSWSKLTVKNAWSIESAGLGPHAFVSGMWDLGAVTSAICDGYTKYISSVRFPLFYFFARKNEKLDCKNTHQTHTEPNSIMILYRVLCLKQPRSPTNYGVQYKGTHHSLYRIDRPFSLTQPEGTEAPCCSRICVDHHWSYCN